MESPTQTGNDGSKRFCLHMSCSPDGSIVVGRIKGAWTQTDGFCDGRTVAGREGVPQGDLQSPPTVRFDPVLRDPLVVFLDCVERQPRIWIRPKSWKFTVGWSSC